MNVTAAKRRRRHPKRGRLTEWELEHGGKSRSATEHSATDGVELPRGFFTT
jgi:hypothetical protein